MILGAGVGGCVFFVVLCFLPLGKRGSLRITGKLERLDERDIIFSRARYIKGTQEYTEYYSRHPELRGGDDTIRSLPGLFKPGSELYQELDSPVPNACFEVLEDVRGTTEGAMSERRIGVDPSSMSRRLKGLAHYYGARRAGIARLHQAHVYTHIGRGLGRYGEAIDLGHTFALVFTVEMDRFMVRQAPTMPVLFESAHQYVRAAAIALPLAYYLRSLGYSARAHIDGNYRIIVPPIAVDAGLGEIGRIGLLMTPDLGPRVRLGAVTTDMPLHPDQPISFGAIDFCETCRKCAENCPSGAIPQGGRKVVRGVEKWLVHQEACYTYWRKTGTDCAICMSVCPYAKEDAVLHNVVRCAAQQSVVARRAAKWADDLFYGLHPRSNKRPAWMKS
jgi:ferredoxin